MSRCPYCRRELPGFETLCQQCFEKGYEQVAHPKPWWQRHRPRLTSRSFYAFVFMFIYVYVTFRINRDQPHAMTDLVLLAMILAAGLILIGLAFRDFKSPKVRHGGLFSFLALSLYFFVRLWRYSSYHPIPNPELWALVAATISAIVESFRGDSDQNAEQEKKAPEDFRRL